MQADDTGYGMSPWTHIAPEDLTPDMQLLLEALPLSDVLRLIQHAGGTRVYVYRPTTPYDYPDYSLMASIRDRVGEHVVRVMERLTPGLLSIPSPRTVWRQAAHRLLAQGSITPQEAMSLFGLSYEDAHAHAA